MDIAFQCPRSGQPLQLASPQLIDQLNDLIRSQRAVTVEGRAVTMALQGGWYCSTSRSLYPVRDGVLCLLTDQALELPAKFAGDPLISRQPQDQP